MNRDKAVFYFMAVFALASCALPLVTHEEMTESMWYSKPLIMPKNRVTVTVLWTNKISEYCIPGALACAISLKDECFIYAPRPNSWNDTVMFRRLGHELSHCFGGEHE